MSKLPPPTKQNKGNSIGNTELREVIKDASKLLPTINKIEKKKIKNGFRWLVKDRESRLVSPEKIQSYLDNGYRLNLNLNQ